MKKISNRSFAEIDLYLNDYTAKIIRMGMEAKECTNEILAEATGTTAGTIGRIRGGASTTIETLLKILYFLEIDPSTALIPPKYRHLFKEVIGDATGTEYVNTHLDEILK